MSQTEIKRETNIGGYNKKDSKSKKRGVPKRGEREGKREREGIEREIIIW